MATYPYSHCPNGFVTPSDLADSGVWYPNRTYSDCAFRCDRFAMYTDAEWDRITFAVNTSSTIGLVMIIITLLVQLCSSLCSPGRVYQYFILASILLSLIEALTDVIAHSKPTSERWCRNNAVLLDGSDGVTACAVQGFITLYCKLAVLFCCTIQAGTTFALVVLEKNGSHVYKRRQVFIIFGIPFVACIIVASNNAFGAFWMGAGTCLIVPEHFVNYFFPFLIIVMLCMVLTIGAMTCVMVKFSRLLYRTWKTGVSIRPSSVHFINNVSNMTSYHTTEVLESNEGDLELLAIESSRDVSRSTNTKINSNSLESQNSNEPVFAPSEPIDDEYEEPQGFKNPILPYISITGPKMNDSQLWDIFVLLRTPLLFTVFFVVLNFASILTLSLTNRQNQSAIHVEYDAWGSCVLHHYDGTDNSWVSSCGAHPTTRLSIPHRLFLVLATSGQAMFVACIGSPSSIAFLFKCYDVYNRSLSSQ